MDHFHVGLAPNAPEADPTSRFPVGLHLNSKLSLSHGLHTNARTQTVKKSDLLSNNVPVNN